MPLMALAEMIATTCPRHNTAGQATTLPCSPGVQHQTEQQPFALFYSIAFMHGFVDLLHASLHTSE